MARTGVTYADVSTAAEALRDSGTPPTVDRVRERLGTGSKSTITRHLKQWREQQEETKTPHDLPSDLINTVRNVYQRLQHEADARIDESTDHHNAIVAEYKQHLRQATADLEASQARAKQLEMNLKTRSEDFHELQQQLISLKLQATKTESQKEEALRRIDDLKSMLAALQQETRASQARFEHYQHQMSEDRQRERNEANRATQQLQTQLHQATEQLLRADARYESLTADHRNQSQLLANTKRELHELQQRHAKTAQNKETLSKQNLDLTTKHDALLKQVNKSDLQIAALSREAAISQALAKEYLQQLSELKEALRITARQLDQKQEVHHLSSKESKDFVQGRSDKNVE